MEELKNYIDSLPEGYSEVRLRGQRYGVIKELFNGGRSIKVRADQLGGNDFVSFNYYLTRKGSQLKPCEMARSKVIEFLTERETL